MKIGKGKFCAGLKITNVIDIDNYYILIITTIASSIETDGYNITNKTLYDLYIIYDLFFNFFPSS